MAFSGKLLRQWLYIVADSRMESKNKNIKNSLVATWNASHLAVRLCALRHWKRVSMPPTTQSRRHPLTRAAHFAPRIKTARRFTAKNPWWLNKFLKRGCINLPQRFFMVGTRYFASASNSWYSIWSHNYGRTWSITSLPELIFRRRRVIFVSVPPSIYPLNRAESFLWLFVWFGDEAAAVVVIEGDNVHFKQLHDGIFGGEARNVCQFWETRQGDASMEV